MWLVLLRGTMNLQDCSHAAVGLGAAGPVDNTATSVCFAQNRGAQSPWAYSGLGLSTTGQFQQMTLLYMKWDCDHWEVS